ncbi:MAG: hypothetical protein EA362_02265 [Saprospirales bacterium]|nr:MAG: hypothetical protein EA362_02265 [Saprospirales bacterium]
MRFLLPILFIFLSLSLYAQDDNSSFPSNGIVVTPLMGLINDQIPSFYYKRYFTNDTSSYTALRVGSGFISERRTQVPVGWKTRASGWNLKLGMEFGKRFDRSYFYYGAEISRTVINTMDSYLLARQGALFSSGKYEERSAQFRDKGYMRMTGFIIFAGFRYQFNQHFSIGTEAAFGIARARTILDYDRERTLAADEVFKIRLTEFIPVRFITVEYSF